MPVYCHAGEVIGRCCWTSSKDVGQVHLQIDARAARLRSLWMVQWMQNVLQQFNLCDDQDHREHEERYK